MLLDQNKLEYIKEAWKQVKNQQLLIFGESVVYFRFYFWTGSLSSESEQYDSEWYFEEYTREKAGNCQKDFWSFFWKEE